MAPPAVHPVRVESIDDPRLGDYRDLADGRLRDRSRGFAAETREVVRRLLVERRFRVRSVLATEPAVAALSDVLDATVPVYVAAHAVIRGVVGFAFHRGCLAIAERGTPLGLDAVLAAAPQTVVVGERIANPDNVGGLFRNAMAFGADAVVLSPGSADPLYRKVVRVSIGGSVAVPFVETTEWPSALDRLRAAGFTIVALTPRGGVDLAGLPPPSRSALLVGTEGDGLSSAAASLADVRATIPMAPGVDSLNVAVACAIALDRLVPRARRGGR